MGKDAMPKSEKVFEKRKIERLDGERSIRETVTTTEVRE